MNSPERQNSDPRPEDNQSLVIIFSRSAADSILRQKKHGAPTEGRYPRERKNLMWEAQIGDVYFQVVVKIEELKRRSVRKNYLGRGDG